MFCVEISSEPPAHVWPHSFKELAWFTWDYPLKQVWTNDEHLV
ncbi:hypothetical protein V1279_001937 [Bradyrhizobium sp. AZCC 1610]